MPPSTLRTHRKIASKYIVVANSRKMLAFSPATIAVCQSLCRLLIAARRTFRLQLPPSCCSEAVISCVVNSVAARTPPEHHKRIGYHTPASIVHGESNGEREKTNSSNAENTPVRLTPSSYHTWNSLQTNFVETDSAKHISSVDLRA